MEKFNIVLKEKHFCDGLNRDDIMEMLPLLEADEFLPIESEENYQECSAIGFITTEAATMLDFDYEESGLNDFIAILLDDRTRNAETREYDFRGIKIYLYR